MTASSTDDDPRDNPVWHALSGPLSGFADPSTPPSGSRVLRFDPAFALFGAVDRLDDDAWSAIAETIGPSGYCALFRGRVDPPPDGWEEHFRGVCYQMQADRLDDRPRFEFDELGTEDAEEMLALAQATEPGPFFARTGELGRFIGVRRGGRLVAMAGQRFRVPGHVEVSAVCTHPDVRGEGLGGMLTLEIAHGIRAGGDEAFLHVLHGNESAARLYRKIGFSVRRNIVVVAAQWHGDGRPFDAPRESNGESPVGDLSDRRPQSDSHPRPESHPQREADA